MLEFDLTARYDTQRLRLQASYLRRSSPPVLGGVAEALRGRGGAVLFHHELRYKVDGTDGTDGTNGTYARRCEIPIRPICPTLPPYRTLTTISFFPQGAVNVT